ncbi:MAG TPA: hypothetical protein VGO11_21960 [Chthoniobacteraceae bacterium]|jgi:hypothetical protein|nr:hypothetical protein [Chthoniobacteraceae bacterium]
MKNILPLLLAALLLLASSPGGSAAPPLPMPKAGQRLPGVELAQGITQLTGVAISPLLGVSSVGAWTYYHAPAELRAALPWYCQPYFWAAGFGLLAICFLKDTLGVAAPSILKKPLDVIELFENKLSALVACSAFLPFIVSQMAPHALALPEASLSTGTGLPLASIHLAAGGWLDSRFVTMPLTAIGFLTVWLASHAINVLITLSPFTIVDSLLKILKAGLLALVLASSAVSPYLGAAVCVVILLVAVSVAPWAFRITVFGTLFGLDVLMPRRGGRRVRATEPHAFLARKMSGVPTRTYGRLARAESGEVTFVYRPWLVLPRRTMRLAPGSVAVAKGVLFPSLLHATEAGERRAILVMFLPRYRSHEQTIAAHFEIAEIVDSPLLKGFRAIRAWFTDTFSPGRRSELPHGS